MILVSPDNFQDHLTALSSKEMVAVDTETTGLYPYKRDRLFSIQVSDDTEDYYFNFKEYGDGGPQLSFEHIKEMQPLFENRLLFLQNAKFDMAFLYKEGIRFDKAEIHDTECAGRIVRNDHLKYSLDEQSRREFGTQKDDAVMEWLKKNKCFTSINVPGKDTPYKAFHFDRVPFELITAYGCKDTRLTYDLGMKQIAQLKALASEASPGTKSVMDVWEMEKKLTHTCFEMERVGIKINAEYCREAIKFETERIETAERHFTELTGLEITDSGKFLGPIFEGFGFTPGKTETGEHEITDKFLSSTSHALADVVREYRDARKRANTYFKPYLHYADADDVIHSNMKQAGTKTGRFSYMDPNLQNIPSEDDSKFPVRRAFIPRPGYFFLSIDYKQMEFRMMLDEAGQQDLINKIKAGHDPHDATAELTGLSRKSAKTLNFALLYGIGIQKLADALSVTFEEAKSFKRKYFAALPMVENFILQCSGAVRTRSQRDPGNGWIKTWFGRRGYFNDEKWAYKAANFKIQGGAADTVKLAMNKLREIDARMCVQIHDELLFEIPLADLSKIEPIINIMETAYPHRFIPLTCSMSYSLESFYDMIEQDPRDVIGKTSRNFIQGTDPSPTEEASEYVGRENSTTVH